MKYFVLICCVVILACNSASTTTPSTDSTATAEPVTVQPDTAAAIVTPSCYAHQTSNNIVLLKLDAVQPTVSGHLTYDFMGQDKHDGAIRGTMHGDTLYADYKFTLKGKQYVRQVAFLRRGEVFIEGTGETKQEGGTTVFSNTDSVNFNGVILKEVPCTQP